MEAVCAKMHGVSETMGRLEWNGRPMIPGSTIKSAPGATQDSLTKLIFEQLEKMSKSLDRLEERLQREDRWPRRRRRGGPVRCHRCQQPGHIARHCRAPAPIPAGRRQPSVAANSAPECDARNSAVPAAAVEPDKRSNGVDRKSVLSLTDTISDAGAVSQASSSKPRGQRRRSRRKTASPRFPDVVPHPEDAETGCVAIAYRRPTNIFPQVKPAESHLGQSIVGGTQKAPATLDAPQHESPVCVSAGEMGKFNTPPPQVVKNRGWCVVVPGRPPSASVATDEQSLVTVDEAPQPRSRRPSLLPLRRQPRRDTKRPARYT